MGIRQQKFIDGKTVGASEVIAWTATNESLKVALEIKNTHATQTLDYTVYGRVAPASDIKDILQAKGTLPANSGVILTVTDIATLNDGYTEIGIGYEQTDGSNKGTITAHIARTR